MRSINSSLERANTSLQGQLGRHWFVNPGDYMSHKISFDPKDNTCFHVCQLEKTWVLWVFDAANDMNHVSHPPITVLFNDHGHACFDMQEQWVAVRPCCDDRMINRHPLLSSRPTMQAVVQVNCNEQNRRLKCG